LRLNYKFPGGSGPWGLLLASSLLHFRFSLLILWLELFFFFEGEAKICRNFHKNKSICRRMKDRKGREKKRKEKKMKLKASIEALFGLLNLNVIYLQTITFDLKMPG
jgi:hypothetical protein